jgi:hypothetical protein
MATTLAQQRAVAIAPKFTAGLSAISSLVTCVLILRPKRGGGGGGARPPTRNKNGTYHRLVLGMSLCCLSSSVAWFFTTWPIPRGTPGVYGAIGTQGTCTAQAFFAQFSLSSVMYNASLSVYFVLVIVRGWSDGRISRIEPFIHLHAIAWGLGTACASVGLGLFNQVGWDCWISASPIGCKESWKNDGVTTCERGDNGSLYQWAFYYAPLWAVITVVMILMYWVYRTVRVQERKMELRGSILSDDRGRLKKSRQTAVQAAFYVGAFYVTWFFPTVFQLVLVTSGDLYFILLFLTAFFVPIQGLLNLIVFVRPKYGRYVKRNPDQNTLLAWFRMIRAELGCGSGPSEASEISSGRTSFRISLRPSLPGLFTMKNVRKAAIPEPAAAADAAAAAAAAETGHGQVIDVNNDTRS